MEIHVDLMGNPSTLLQRDGALMRQSRIAVLENRCAALEQLVEPIADRFEAERLERDAQFDRKLHELERRLGQPSPVFDVRLRMNFDRGQDQ